MGDIKLRLQGKVAFITGGGGGIDELQQNALLKKAQKSVLLKLTQLWVRARQHQLN